MKTFFIFLLVFLFGCGGAAVAPARSATTAAVAALDAPAARAEVADVASAAADRGTTAAVAVVAAPATKAAVAGTVAAARDAALDPVALRAAVAVARDTALDPAVLDAARERLVGPALRADLTAAVDAASVALTGHLESTIAGLEAKARSDADAELSKLRPVVYSLVAAVGALLVALAALARKLKKPAA